MYRLNGKIKSNRIPIVFIEMSNDLLKIYDNSKIYNVVNGI